ncbi:DUF4192 domain-containing protein [Rhodococcus erythropolis]|uniref:DUF4192 domain-containing protein n=1 Tax=Rhodococcus erythropolis TaxID=1833 RepID=UPI00294A3BC8|nr:DUF4192 domain-containing protein [Rhodococcus erythropolis]MDV6273920.1 DUF4192 domain-containing protein [Rhodococcus erythropolis]
MTTSPLPGEFEFSDDDLAAILGCVERVSDPGELIAAIPALLGFHPSNSVVALSLMGSSASTLGPVMRHDYFPSAGGKPARQMSAALRQFAAVCDGEGARAVVLVVITDCSAGETLVDETIELAEVFEDMLGGTCVELADVLCTTAIESGQTWASVMRSIHRGTLPDPASSPVAAAQVLGGRVIRSSREELVHWVNGAGRNHDMIARLIASGRESSAYGGGSGGDAAVQRRVDLVLEHVRSVEEGSCPGPQECADLVVALTDVHVRDVVLGLAITSVAAAAEQLWLVLTHEVPSPERAWPATLLGFFAYVRGDGPLAGVALSAALSADSEHTLAGLLDLSLQSGVRPDGIRDLAAVGLSIGTSLGIAGLPPALPGGS